MRAEVRASPMPMREDTAPWVVKDRRPFLLNRRMRVKSLLQSAVPVALILGALTDLAQLDAPVHIMRSLLLQNLELAHNLTVVFVSWKVAHDLWGAQHSL
jgi:hypothetical protein